MKTKTKRKIKSKPVRRRKQQKKKIIVASLAVGAAGILGYFGWKYLQKSEAAKNGGGVNDVLKTINSNYDPKPVYTSAKLAIKNTPAGPQSTMESDSFPLKKGSRGNNVRLLQEALIAKYGKSILPKYGADGDFGSETVNALKKAGLPTTITESTFNLLPQGTKVDTSAPGKALYNAASSKNYAKTISLLKQMQTTEDYTSANEIFKQNRISGVRQTIVNGLLNVFTTNAQKQAIKFEFLRIGLQFDGKKWGLSGLDGLPIMTKESTMVWVSANEGVKVPARMVLGNEVTKKLDYTLFENKGKYFLVNTKSVQYLN